MPRLRTLIVEDSEPDAELLCAKLRQQGYDLDARVVSTEADYLAALKTAPEVIFADYRLPSFCGLRALQLLRGRGLDTPFILVSGTIGDELAVAAMHAGADDFVQKDKLDRINIALDRAFEKTKTRRTLQLVQTEVERLAAIVESNNDAIVSRSLDKTILSWNAAAERMFGWSRQEAIGRPITIIVSPEDCGELGPVIQHIVAGMPAEAVERRRMRKDGTWIDTSITFFPIKNSSGIVAGIALIYRDITQKKQTDAVLRESEERFRATFEQAAVGMALRSIDPLNSRWLRVNQKLCDILGYTAAELLQLNSVDLTPAEDRGLAIDYNEKMLRGEISSYSREKRYLRKDGSLAWTNLSITAVHNQEGRPTHVISVIQDISAHKKAELAVQASEVRMRAILEAQPVCVQLVAADGSPIEINHAGLAMFEAESVEQVSRHELLNFVLPKQRAQFSEHFSKALAGESSILEFEMVGLKGTHRWMESHATRMLMPENGTAVMLSVTSDVTERKKTQQRIAYLSQYDTLTGLPNRNLFRDRLGLAVAKGKRRGEMTGIMLFNLDRFKQVNEGLGREAGDDLLRQAAGRLKDTLREVDTIARLGGDEFAILAENVPGSADVITIAEKLTEAFTAPFTVAAKEIHIVASIGISMHPNGTDDPDKLLKHAEVAMNFMKHEGGGGYRVYENETTTPSKSLDLETRLRYALDRGELQVHYQPKLRLRDGTITGVEALLRWNNPDLGAVSPAKFIPVAEATGLIVPIGAWVLRTACSQMQSWHAQGHFIGVAVNLSPRQFRQKDLVGAVASALKETGLAPPHLELEITEGTAMTNAAQAVKVLGELHGLGIKLAVDDFGTGYSSLAYLKRFPLDTLKIDRSFVVDIGVDSNNEAIVNATIALAHSLRLKVVAEGVETETQREFLAHAGCDEMQGFLYSRPLPAADLLILLQEQR